MKKIFMLAMVSTVLTFCATAQPSFEAVKDTCSCQPPVKKSPPSPRPWKYVVEEKNQAKGLITGSFNDSIVIEDYGGSGTIPLSTSNVPERFFPPVVSNLKEVNGSFNRHISYKRMPAPECHRHHHHDGWYDNLGWLWFLLFLGLIALVIYMLTRQNQTPITIENNIPPSPPAPPHRTTVTPALDMKEMFKQAVDTGCTVQVFDNGGFKIVPPVKKEEKPGDVKKPTDDGGTKEEVKK
jgi:hypothetical protein